MKTTFENNQTYLSFWIEGSLFAVSTDNIKEVLVNERIITFSNSLDFSSGGINYKGDILPIVDACKILGLGERNQFEKNTILVLDLNIKGNLQIGILIDSTDKKIDLKKDDLHQIPNVDLKFNAKIINGIYKYDDDFILILNLENLLSIEEINSLEKIPAES